MMWWLLGIMLGVIAGFGFNSWAVGILTAILFVPAVCLGETFLSRAKSQRQSAG